ncbi:hypothetical protein [Uruburuella suis]|jgi:hypothetical protein|uniref:hypothetical protein n=1 Tax=Uruburuella suis TaxID=252130 RepID=UPI001B61E448|nr:hypothetical protein [Uruburuella suis]MBP8875978.1 hypothetical protein [Neisseria sp.]
MNIRCSNCGAVHSLDALIADAEAAEVLRLLLEMDGGIGKAAVRYLGLFRPAKSQLGWGRMAKLLKEILPDIQTASIRRDGVAVDAPAAAWLYGFDAALAARDAGRLKTPLKSHGYLYEIISHWQPQSPHPNPPPQAGEGNGGAAADTKLRQGVAALSAWAGDDWARQEIAAGFALMSAQIARGKPAAKDLPVVAGIWLQRLQERPEGLAEEYDRPRFQMAFKQLAAAEEWPNVAAFIRNLPPRLIPRKALAAPPPDREAGRQKSAELKSNLNRVLQQKGS